MQFASLNCDLKWSRKGAPLEPAHELAVPDDLGRLFSCCLDLDDEQVLPIGAHVEEAGEGVEAEAADFVGEGGEHVEELEVGKGPDLDEAILGGTEDEAFSEASQGVVDGEELEVGDGGLVRLLSE